MKVPLMIITLCYFLLSASFAQDSSSIFEMNNLLAWCIVPFDSVQRTPEQRAKMLHDLGFRKFAYDWRDQHLESFPRELVALQSHGIELSAFWLWIDDQPFPSPTHTRIFEMLKSLNVRTTFWISFSNAVFKGRSDEDKLATAVEIISIAYELASNIGCTIALYNHGDWFGDPENQVAIIQATGFEDIGIVYNFHHGHHQMRNFDHLLNIMMPYLQTVNLNGMIEDGPKIIPIGAGGQEDKMLETLTASGFSGTIGILGHVENADVERILRQNLLGLRAMGY